MISAIVSSFKKMMIGVVAFTLVCVVVGIALNVAYAIAWFINPAWVGM